MVLEQIMKTVEKHFKEKKNGAETGSNIEHIWRY